MKGFKVLIAALAVLATAAFGFGCQPREEGTVQVYMPDGAPALAMAQMMEEKPVIRNMQTVFHIVKSTDNIAAYLTRGDADLCIVPTNVAAKMYNGGVDYRLVSANVHGILYLVGTGSAETLSDLVGKVVLNTAAGGTTDLVFKYILDLNDIEYEESADPVEGKVALRYVSAGTEIIQLMKAGQAEYGVMGQPQVAMAQANIEGARQIFDLQELWKEGTGSTDSYPQASLVVKADFLAEYPEVVEAFLDKLTQNDTWVVENADKLQGILAEYESSITVNFTSAIVEACNLRTVPAPEARAAVETYLNSIMSFDPSFIGGKLPDDAFYVSF